MISTMDGVTSHLSHPMDPSLALGPVVLTLVDMGGRRLGGGGGFCDGAWLNSIEHVTGLNWIPGKSSSICRLEFEKKFNFKYY